MFASSSNSRAGSPGRTRQPDRCGSRGAVRRRGTAGIVWARATHGLRAGRRLRSSNGSPAMPSVTNWTVRTGPWPAVGHVVGNDERGNVPRGAGRPSRRRARTCADRSIMAPTSAVKPLRWSALCAETRNVMPDVPLAVGTSTSPEKYQSKTSATPWFRVGDVVPVYDIDISATTFAHHLCSFSGGGVALPQRLGRGRRDHR